MILSNLGVLNSLKTLNSFSESKLPQKISYAITRNMMTLQKEYLCYEAELNKLMDKYKDHFVKDEDGNTMYNEGGIPVVKDSALSDFNNDLYVLLSIEINVDIFKIPEEIFNYDDSRYDALTGKDIFVLQQILCGAE